MFEMQKEEVFQAKIKIVGVGGGGDGGSSNSSTYKLNLIT
jgi:hypothetical protein